MATSFVCHDLSRARTSCDQAQIIDKTWVPSHVSEVEGHLKAGSTWKVEVQLKLNLIIWATGTGQMSHTKVICSPVVKLPEDWSQIEVQTWIIGAAWV